MTGESGEGIKSNIQFETAFPQVETPQEEINLSQMEAGHTNSSQPLERRPNLEYRPSYYELSEFSRIEDRDEEDEDEVLTTEGSSDEESDVGESTPMTQHNKMKFSDGRSLWRVIAACMWCLTSGFNDGAPGVFLPYMEEQYNIEYSIVSLIWLGNAVGFILVAFSAHKINVWFGKLKSLPLGSFFMILMYALVLTGSKFPVIILGFFFGGVGNGICVSHFNVFLSHFEKTSTALGYFHGSYGLGATVSPLIATAFIDHGIAWHWFYLILLGMMFFNMVNIFFAFRGVDSDMGFGKDGKDLQASNEENSNDRSNLFLEILRNKATWITSFWVLFYQGGEVAIGGWFVTYLRDYRKNTSPSIGYIVSGYWLGLTLGRLVLTRLCHKHIGARRGNIILTVLSILFIMLTWVIPHLVLEGVFVSVAGLCIGPLYPLMVTLVSRLLPRKILVVSLTITTAFGSSGGALFPFLIGLISQFAGAYVVLPSFIAIFSAMLVLWILLPNVENRRAGEKMNYINRIW